MISRLRNHSTFGTACKCQLNLHSAKVPVCINCTCLRIHLVCFMSTMVLLGSETLEQPFNQKPTKPCMCCCSSLFVIKSNNFHQMGHGRKSMLYQADKCICELAVTAIELFSV